MRLPHIAIHLFHGRDETWKRYPNISRWTDFSPILKINEIATDCYSFIAWKNRNLKEVFSDVKINWILPHFENKWDCHRLLFIDFMEETKLERGTLKFQDQLDSFTCWKWMRLTQIPMYSCHGSKDNWKRYPHIARSTESSHILRMNEIATDCYSLIALKKRSLKEVPSNLKIDEFVHMLKINEIATDCCLSISWKRNLKEIPSNFKINRILPHFENKWDCHRLLFIYFMKEKKLERGTLKCQDQMNSSTFWT